MFSSVQPLFRTITPTLIVSRPPQAPSAAATNDGAVIINYPLPTGDMRPETPEWVRERPKENIVDWREWRAQPYTQAMRRKSYDQDLVRSQNQQECDAASLNVGPGTDIDDFDECWAPNRDGMLLFGHGGLYIDPAFLFINRKNPSPPLSSPATATVHTVLVGPGASLCPDHLQYKGKTFHLPGYNDEDGYEGGCESTFLPGPRSLLATLDEEDADGDTDDLWDCPSIISFEVGDNSMSIPELSFSGSGTPFATTPDDEVDVQLGTPGLSNSATLETTDNAPGFSFGGKPPHGSPFNDRSLNDAQSDEEEYPGFPLSSLSPFDKRFPLMADVDEELRKMRPPYDPRIRRRPLPLGFRLVFGALERWAARRTAGLPIPLEDGEGGSDGEILEEGTE